MRNVHRHARLSKRRQSAPENYDPDANRVEYLQAFGEFKERASLYKQSTNREGSEATGSQSTNTATDQSNSNGYQQQDQPKSGTTKGYSLPNKIARSLFGGSPRRKTNTANNTLAVNENNNSIYTNEILEFDGNCINDGSFVATAQSPPTSFYKNNSIPFSPSAQRSMKIQSELSSAPIRSKASSAPIQAETLSAPIQAEASSAPIQAEASSAPIQAEASSAPIQAEASSAPKTVSKIEEARQRAYKKLLDYIRPKAKSGNASNSSGAYRQYDLDSSDVEERTLKKSNGQDIPQETYNEIASAFEDMAQLNGYVPRNERDIHNNSYNSRAMQSFEHGITGISPLSEFSSYRRCEGLIDENFGFLDDTKWGKNCMDESDLCTANDEALGMRVKDESDERLRQQEIEYYLSGIEPVHKCSRNTNSLVSPQVSKQPVYVMECKAKDIQPIISSLQNTTSTPFQLSAGCFRQNIVSLKKCSPRDSASIRLVEEAIERDFDILSKVKHPNIVALMAVSCNRKLINHMTLVMEQVDYTLNFYLHQMERSFTLLECTSITYQISSAIGYLHACGYIHSNISSHNILFRERPCSVKLSSFELATDIDCSTIRAEIESCYPQLCTQQSVGLDDDNVALKEHYKKQSKRTTYEEHDYIDIPSKYLMYDTTYRRHLSEHNFTAPELLAADRRFVFPTPKTDVYSLCLLLWELLNHCVPFAVYNRLDMERMIATEKLNLPFFERDRCYSFMGIFGAGLAIRPENRTMDVPALMTRLSNIEADILMGFANIRNADSIERDYVNCQQQTPSEYLDDTVTSSLSFEMNGNIVDMTNDIILSPSLLAFDQSLNECERTSTKKIKKKPARNGHRIRELFPSVDENFVANGGVHEYSSVHGEDRGHFVDLNKSFMEMSNDIRRHVFYDIDEDEKLNKNLAELAENLCRNILNDTEENISIDYQPQEVHSKFVAQSSAEPKNANNVPTVVGFSVKNRNLNNSKTCGNFLETLVPSAAKNLFNFSNEYDFDSEGRMHDAMPNFARQNKLRRNAWLSNQEPNTSRKDNKSEHMVEGDDKEAVPVDVYKKVNVSVRIVHNKMTPEKVAPKVTEVQPKDVNEERPSVLSKIQFFNSANQAATTRTSLSTHKHPIAPVKVDQVVSDNNPVSSSDKIVNEHVDAVASKESKFVNNNVVLSDNSKAERNVVMNELTDAMHNLHKRPLDPPQKKQLFENKLWKRELDICNRSLNSSEGSCESKIVTPKIRSVRDTIMKFEKRSATKNQSTSNSSSTSNELVKSSPKPITTSQPNHQKQNDSPTLIKRTIYSEQILSGIDLSPLDNPLFKFGGQKVATRVSMRQVRQTSSADVGANNRRQMGGKTDIQHTMCGNEVQLLNFNSSGCGPSGAATKCFNCAMCSDQLETLTYEPIDSIGNISDSNLLPESPTRCGQVRVKNQDTRSIEDLYIDDDFVHGLGANMELQSNYSDSLIFDLISSGLY
ncbi:uncharacterized protein LOC119078051 isoform X2 [Bradysia coprophila]|uniref:uncharacterized protein LOC119078051 isoform X2 n=1 Tax=Bradysia coprophila TaxID=38358 RepID=UPI00187D84E4|nr:uncharacterized protein LOC119078051 isoform X2 [Bradysia coprophila]